MKRNVGRLGESELKKWCEQVGITCNPSLVDEKAWDYLLEFTLPMENDTIHDGNQLNIECKIQVKSTDGTDTFDDVKLSNWKDLVESPLPCFFLALMFNGKNDVHKAFLVHVDQDYQEKYLEKRRKLEQKGELDKLHKKTMRFHWSDYDQIAEFTGQGLLNAILDRIGSSMHSYAKSKISNFENVGFDEQKNQLNTLIKIPEGYSPNEFLADLELGIIPSAELQSFEDVEVRFGIPVLKSEHENAQISIHPELTEPNVKIIFSSDRTMRKAEFNAHLVAPSRVLAVKKLRITSPIINMIIGENAEPKISITNLDHAGLYSIEDLEAYANLIKIFSGDRSKELSYFLEIKFDGDKVIKLEGLNRDFDIFNSYEEIASTILNFAIIARHFEISSTELVRLSHVGNNAGNINQAIFMVSPANVKFRISFEPIEKESRLFVPVYRSFQIAHYQILIARMFTGLAADAIESDESGKLWIENAYFDQDIQINQKIQVDEDSEDIGEKIKTMLFEMIEVASNHGRVVFDAGVAKFLFDETFDE